MRGGIVGLVISGIWALQGVIRNGLEHSNKDVIIINLFIVIFFMTVIGVIIGWLYGKIFTIRWISQGLKK